MLYKTLREGMAVVTKAVKGETPAPFTAATVISYIVLFDNPVKVMCRSVVKRLIPTPDPLASSVVITVIPTSLAVS